MARAKNTSRAEARRRTRATLRSELTDEEGLEEEAAAEESSPKPARRPLFKMPNVREDVRLLVPMFRARRLLFLPLLLFVVGFVFLLVGPALPPALVSIGGLYIQFFFLPPALFTFFIAGFLAPRASYLVGLLYGGVGGASWAILTLWLGIGFTANGVGLVSDRVGYAVNEFLSALVFGTLAAAFAAWYRDWLRQMQDRGRKRQTDKEMKEKARRREERQEARRVAKGRPSS